MLEFNFSPFPELRTERVFLRKLTKSDAEEILFLRSSEDVLRYIGREPAKSIKEAEEFIDKIKPYVNPDLVEAHDIEALRGLDLDNVMACITDVCEDYNDSKN